MSTQELSSGARRGTLRQRLLAVSERSDAADVLGLALVVLLLYAACAHGAAGSPAEPRLQVAVALVGALVGGVWLWGGGLRVAAPRLAWAGLGLLGAFTVWSAVSLAWSVAPDDTWIEVNRYVTYTVVLFLAIVYGASARRPLERAQHGFLALALLITFYALGQKLLPWLHVPGLIDLDQTGAVARLQQPFGYWNALALFLVMGVPLALSLCIDRTRSPRTRISGVVALELMFLAIGFTYSRGAVVAFVFGIGAALALGGGRLRGLLWLAMAALGSLVPLLLGLLNPQINRAGVSLASRSLAGVVLLILVLVSLAGLTRLARRVLAREQVVRVTPERSRRIARGLVAALGLAVVVALVGVSISHRGLTGSVTHVWHDFTAGKGINDTNPNNLVSADSGNRWIWWKEAVGAFSARPVGGWGAGSFPVVHLLYRRDALGTKQPHSVPLQYLAETGVIGAVLALGAFALLLASGLRMVRRRPPGRERMIAAALFGAAIAYCAHACYDWDSDIPGVTLPVLVFLGVLAAAAGRAGLADARPAAGPGRLPVSLPDWSSAGSLVRLAGGALAAVVMCAYAVSATLPSLAAGDASTASVAAAAGTAASIDHAEQQAALSGRLDPLSDAGLMVRASIALRRDQTGAARSDLLAALRRDPSDPQAWATLAVADLAAHDPPGAIAATAKAVALDPHGEESLLFGGSTAATAVLDLAPPQDSPSAVQTPADGQYGTAPGALTGPGGAAAP